MAGVQGSRKAGRVLWSGFPPLHVRHPRQWKGNGGGSLIPEEHAMSKSSNRNTLTGRVSDRDASLTVCAGHQGQVEITAHVEGRDQYFTATLPRLSTKAARELAALLIHTAEQIEQEAGEQLGELFGPPSEPQRALQVLARVAGIERQQQEAANQVLVELARLDVMLKDAEEAGIEPDPELVQRIRSLRNGEARS